MYDLSLIDLMIPYLLRGSGFGPWHPALAALAVDEHETAISPEGVVIRGRASFKGSVRPFVDLDNMRIGVEAENKEGHPLNDPGRRNPWMDIRDSKIEFQLTAPRIASQKIAQAVTALAGNPDFKDEADLLSTLGDGAVSDFPNTEFTLDLLLAGVVLRPPFLRGAKRGADGQLIPDPHHAEVKFTLPKVKARLAQGSGVNDPLTAAILSAGASGLDDPGDLSTAELVTMDPPYAFIGDKDIVGFGFRSAVLDLSDGFTPPAVLSQFGYDESWQGLYLPEIRLFVAPSGAKDLAVDGGAINLLIGFGQSAGITGDFDLTVLNQGEGVLKLGARFYDAAGKSYGITRNGDKKASVQLPEHTRMIIDIDGGRTPFTASASIDGAVQNGREHDIDMTGNTVQRTVLLKATDSSGTPKEATLELTITRLQIAAAVPTEASLSDKPDSNPVKIETTSIKQGTKSVNSPVFKVIQETGTTAIIGLAPSGAAKWTVGGIAAGTGETVTVNVAPEANISVKAELPGRAGVDSFTAFYRFDHPLPTEGPAYSLNKANSRTEPAPDQGPTASWTAGSDSLSALAGMLESVPAGSKIKIEGFASFEGPDSTQSRTYNTLLARRRADGLRTMIESLGKNYDFNPAPAANMTDWTKQGTELETRRNFWKATASWDPVTADDIVIEGTVSRKPSNPAPGPGTIPGNDPVPAGAPPEPPSWFHFLGAKVRIVRNQFVACEVFGKFDYQTAAEKRLQDGAGPGTTIPKWKGLGSQNPADGLIDVRLVVQIDDATDKVTVTGYLGADPADRDGLALLGTRPDDDFDPNPPDYGLNFLGLSFLFTPLLSALAGAAESKGAIVQMPLTAAGYGVIAGIAATDWFRTERVVWYGGELKVIANDKGEWSTALLLDIETAISMDLLGLVKIRRDAPLSVRYKAIGLLFGAPPGEAAFQFRPIFDSSKGYTIDVSKPGSIEVADPLGSILQVLGAKVARNNPLIFEIDLGFALDLGVISIDRARIRAQVDSDPPQLSITAFGAGVDIPGAVRGRGYVELSPAGIKGSIDITLISLNVRIAAGLAIEKVPGTDVTAVLVSLDAEFPVALPLGTSGLGIYGFLGLFAMHYVRDESGLDANQAPALAWLRKTGGNVGNPLYWKAQAGTWALGLGAVLGTMGSSVIFNMKGMLLLELPGPRLLLMMKANLLKAKPELAGNAEGALFAVIDLDMGRGTIVIGISAEYEVAPLIKIRIPVEAFFNFKDVADWHLNLGTFNDMVHADILEVFEATGYLMISGNGITGHPVLPAVSGFSIATGLHVSFVWGSKPVGLYAELGAGFDAIIGFDPFRFSGILYVRGELNLWIVSISASASLTVHIGEDTANDQIAHISGEIKGEVEFLFFTISGSVPFELGETAVPIPPPPPLGKGLKLISRSPALVVGTGVDRPIDSGIGDAIESDVEPAPDKMPVVPIDAIPVILMAAPPLYGGVKFKDQELQGTPYAAASSSDGWIARGDMYYKYTLKTVELSDAVSEGKTPATWWTPKSGATAFEAQLALLSWIPDPTPKAMTYGSQLEDWVKSYWGTICVPAAPPAPVMWTFLQEELGPTPYGWRLEGKAWPDPLGTIRSTAPDLDMKVVERWRSGDRKLDQLRGVVPAEVQGTPVKCPPAARTVVPRGTSPQRKPIDIIGAVQGVKRAEPVQPKWLGTSDVLRLIKKREPVTRADLLALSTPADQLGRTANTRICQSRVLASPVLDDYWRYDRGPRSDRDQYIQSELKEREYKPGLVDAVICHTGIAEYTTFYLFIPRMLLEQHLLHACVSNGNEELLNTHVVTGADLISAGNPLPSKWMDPNGPWYSDVYRLMQHETYLGRWGYAGVLVTVKGQAEGDRIQIGLKDPSEADLQELKARPFYVAAIESQGQRELLRSDYDHREQGKKQGAAGSVLSSDAADWALLQTDKTYCVTMTWEGERERRPKDKAPEDHVSLPVKTQKFWFRTDANPPLRLDPWMLTSTPDERETHFFSEGAIRLVFATPQVVRMYETYGKRLQVRLKASSYRPIKSPLALPHPLVLTKANVKPVAKSILDPFEEALEKELAHSCVPVDHTRFRHSMVDIGYTLERFTDYIMEVEMADHDAPEGAAGQSIWKRSFSTGGFGTLEEFAQSFFAARVKHRSVGAGTLQAVGTFFAARDPEGNEFDSKMIEAGLEPLEVPDHPELVVFWETSSAAPSPAAIMIDASEPLWRSRMLPREVKESSPVGSKRYEMERALWLEPVEVLGGASIVQRIVPAPGGQRALVILKPDSRGKQLKLALRKIAQPESYLDGSGAMDQFVTFAELILSGAPWEEVD
ncbi:hypothetical protein [Paenibacillus montanisoli]|uniref:Uncharacterized protein n=1 Tax=Paenibacillus montanisoli TaxID=2081970 RepID=A0A328U9X4_9BACL|nr:hypothetical protein [Paenibacillus montanisoli]RAP77725.1 hypothetical protein DL346_04485 [Paenibacillus montanisoli]